MSNQAISKQENLAGTFGSKVKARGSEVIGKASEGAKKVVAVGEKAGSAAVEKVYQMAGFAKEVLPGLEHVANGAYETIKEVSRSGDELYMAQNAAISKQMEREDLTPEGLTSLLEKQDEIRHDKDKKDLAIISATESVQGQYSDSVFVIFGGLAVALGLIKAINIPIPRGAAK